MRRTSRHILISAVVVAASLVAAVPAVADSPHFVTGPTTSTTASGNSLLLGLSFKAAGLGNATSYATWSLTGSGSLSSRCFTKSGNQPQAANKQETVPFNVTFPTKVNHGQTTFSGTVATVTSTLKCPKGQVVRIESFSGSGTLSLVGNDLSAPVSWTFP